MLDTDLAEHMCQALRIPLPDLRTSKVDGVSGRRQLDTALEVLTKHTAPLQIADFLLAHDGHAQPEDLNSSLERGKVGMESRYQVGTTWIGAPSANRRADRDGLVYVKRARGPAGR
jgi:hypothetical protein